MEKITTKPCPGMTATKHAKQLLKNKGRCGRDGRDCNSESCTSRAIGVTCKTDHLLDYAIGILNNSGKCITIW